MPPNRIYLSIFLQLSLLVVLPASNGICAIKRMLIADEGNEAVHYVNLDNSGENWTTKKDNRDMQLIGNNRVLVSISSGYYVLDITNGKVIHEKGGYGEVEAARRLPDGHTWLGTNKAMIELDENDKEVQRVAFTGLTTLRLMRLSAAGNFLRGSGGEIIEGNGKGAIIWEAAVGGDVYQVCRLANGNYIASTGYGKKIVVVNPAKKIVLEMPSTAHSGDTIKPNFYGGFQVLDNGHVVVTNWEGHGGGNGGKGRQVIEYDAQGNLVWVWKQDASFISSIHGIIVLDGLNTDYLHMQYDGTLKPVVDASLTITVPNGGEMWEAGSQRKIAWLSKGSITAVKLEYKLKNNWEEIDPSAPNTGSYLWTIPNHPHSAGVVRVSALNGMVSDTGDAPFSISESTGILELKPASVQGTCMKGRFTFSLHNDCLIIREQTVGDWSARLIDLQGRYVFGPVRDGRNAVQVSLKGLRCKALFLDIVTGKNHYVTKLVVPSGD